MTVSVCWSMGRAQLCNTRTLQVWWSVAGMRHRDGGLPEKQLLLLPLLPPPPSVTSDLDFNSPKENITRTSIKATKKTTYTSWAVSRGAGVTLDCKRWDRETPGKGYGDRSGTSLGQQTERGTALYSIGFLQSTKMYRNKFLHIFLPMENGWFHLFPCISICSILW